MPDEAVTPGASAEHVVLEFAKEADATSKIDVSATLRSQLGLAALIKDALAFRSEDGSVVQQQAKHVPRTSSLTKAPARSQSVERHRCEGQLLSAVSVALCVGSALTVALVDLRARASRLAIAAGLAVAASLMEHSSFMFQNADPPHMREPLTPAPWNPWAAQPKRTVASLFGTMLGLLKVLVFLTFACHSGTLCPSRVAQQLQWASRVLLALHLGLTSAVILLLGSASGSLPNIYPDCRARNPLSRQLLICGAAIGALGIGARGLRRGDAALDACLFAGLAAIPRVLAVFLLDIPHLILGAVLLGESRLTHNFDAEVTALSVATMGSAVLGLLGIKFCWTDCCWFWFGSQYKGRYAYLNKKAMAAARWSVMDEAIRKHKHEARLRREEPEPLPEAEPVEQEVQQ